MSECNRCGNCCKMLLFPVSRDLDQDMVEFYKARGFKVHWMNNMLWVQVDTWCPHLVHKPRPDCKALEYSCRIHETKPKLCAGGDMRKYRVLNCQREPDPDSLEAKIFEPLLRGK